VDPITIADIEKRLRDALGDVQVDHLKKKPEEPPPPQTPTFFFDTQQWWSPSTTTQIIDISNDDLFDGGALDENTPDGIF
jgi:hypothetical protein